MFKIPTKTLTPELANALSTTELGKHIPQAFENWQSFKEQLKGKSHINAVLSIQSLDNENPALEPYQIKELKETRPGLTQIGDGHTGFAMALALNAHFAVLNDKGQREKANMILKNQLKGLIVVTGHGLPNGNSISGNYSKDGSTINVERTPAELVQALMEAGLKEGDKPTILLSVCFSAVSEDSLAHKVAKELAKQGISSTIIASENPVSRFAHNVLEKGRVTFGPKVGMQPKDVCVFTTDVQKKEDNPQISLYRPNETIQLSAAGLSFLTQEELALQKIKDAEIQKTQALMPDLANAPSASIEIAQQKLRARVNAMRLAITKEVFQFSLNRDEAESYLDSNPKTPFILRNSSIKDYLCLSYKDKSTASIIHVLLSPPNEQPQDFKICTLDAQGIKISETGSLFEIIKELVQHKAAPTPIVTPKAIVVVEDVKLKKEESQKELPVQPTAVPFSTTPLSDNNTSLFKKQIKSIPTAQTFLSDELLDDQEEPVENDGLEDEPLHGDDDSIHHDDVAADESPWELINLVNQNNDIAALKKLLANPTNLTMVSVYVAKDAVYSILISPQKHLLISDELLKIAKLFNDMSLQQALVTHPHSDQRLYTELSKNVSSDSVLDDLVEYVAAENSKAQCNLLACKLLSSAQRNTLINKATSAEFFDALEAHITELDDDSFRAILANPNAVTDMHTGFLNEIAKRSQNQQVIKDVLQKVVADEALLMSITQKGVVQDLELLESIVSLTNNTQILKQILKKDRVNEHTSVYVKTLAKLHQKSPNDLSSAQLNYLVEKKAITAREVVFKLDNFFSFDALKAFLSHLITSIKLALGQTITSSRYILFSNMSKDDKDKAINSSLHLLNKSLATGDTQAIKNNFSSLCQIACKRRNWLGSSLISEYSTDTKSAEYLVKEFAKNPVLLGALNINMELPKEDLLKSIRKEMMNACHDDKALRSEPTVDRVKNPLINGAGR